MKCEYTYKTKKYSYSELLEEVDKENVQLDSYDAILYSASKKQDVQIGAVSKIKQLSYTLTKDKATLIDGEPHYTVVGAMPLFDFFDSNAFHADGYTAFNEEDYIKSVTKKYLEEGYTEEAAAKEAKRIVDSWKKLKEDTVELHKLLTNKHILNPNVTIETAVEDLYKSVPDKFKDRELLENIVKSTRAFNMKLGKDYERFRNINMITKTKDGIRLFGHIDLLTIAPDGTVGVYLFKVSTSYSKFWVDEKIEKYKYQLAFLKEMLQQNDVNVKNITLNIVPVYIQYDDNNENVKKMYIENVRSYSTTSQGKYAMAKYDRKVAEYITPKVNPVIQDSSESEAEHNCQLIFPGRGLSQDGFIQSADSYIKQAMDGMNRNLQIEYVDDENPHYLVTITNINSNPITMKTSTAKKGKAYKEIREFVVKYIQELDEDKGYAANTLKNQLVNYFNTGNMPSAKPWHQHVAWSYLKKYMTSYTEVDGKKEYDWELLDNLTDNNILIFRNKKTNTYDYVVISSLDLESGLEGGNLLCLLGYQNSEYIDLEGNFGNVELVRGMTYINSTAKDLPEGAKLGQITVVSPNLSRQQAVTRNINIFLQRHYRKIVELANKKNGKDQIKIHITKEMLSDPTQSILDSYKVAITDNFYLKQRLNSVLEIDNLQKSINQSKACQIAALYTLIESVLSQYPNIVEKNTLERMKSSRSEYERTIANLFEQIIIAFNYLNDYDVKYKVTYNAIDSLFLKAQNVADENIRLITSNMQVTNSAIANEFLDYYQKKVRHQFDSFYQAKGYSKTENYFIGDQVKTFKNLFEYDPETGSNLLIFKNPYDNNNNLSSEERTLLKHIIFEINNIMSKGKIEETYHTCNNEDFGKYVTENEQARWVPLEKASKASSLKNVKSFLTRIQNFWKNGIMSSQSFDYLVNGIIEEERSMIDQDATSTYLVRANNPFYRSIPNDGSDINDIRMQRRSMIKKYGADYFETNLENLLVDVAMKQITSMQFNKFLTCTKAILLELDMMSIGNVSQGVKDKEKEYIWNYLKANVLHKPLMGKTMQRVVGVIHPIKTIVSHMLVGGNVIGAVRDGFEGAQQNFLRSLIKFKTNIDAKNIAKAYAIVTTKQNPNSMSINILNSLCLKYRMSNMDSMQVAERAKTARNGIMNIERAPFYNLRCPDFLNRMTLFVAQCLQDGCWDAFSVNEKGDLMYDARKDKRFAAYLNNDKSDMKAYNTAKSALFSFVIMRNKEKPNDVIDPRDIDQVVKKLDSPYTSEQVVRIRSAADNIYGAYDRSMRPMLENHSYGMLFAMFSTWMSGIVANYFASAQESSIMYKHEQLRDENGNLLYIDNDGNQTITPTDAPLYRDIPLIVQGIFPTLFTIAKLCRSNGMEFMKEYIKANPHEQANLRKLISDILMMLLMTLLFKGILQPKYKDFKKTMKDRPLLANLVTEIIYKGGSKSYDQYAGPLNVLQFFGENMNPPYYTANIKLINDCMRAIFGDKEWNTVLTGNIALFRNGKDSITAYYKAMI